MKWYKVLKLKITQNKFFKSRAFGILVIIMVLYSVVIMQFYKLQIKEHDMHKEQVAYGTQKRQEIEGSRGLIFDRYGTPLAINKPVYTLKVDAQVELTRDELNETLLKVAQALEAHGDTYYDALPISKTTPFIFTQNQSSIKKFVSSIPYNGREHREELLTYSAQELIDYLRSDKVFGIDEKYSDEEARKIIAIRHQMYQFAYQKYKKITIATDLSEETVAMISEKYVDYPGIVVEIESYRYYPYGKALGNVLGYTRKITLNQYETMKDQGYNEHDVIGQMGIEQTMEETLRGQDGLEVIEVDNVGRKVHTLENQPPIQGNDVFLTLDADIQTKVYEAVEKRLADAIVQRLTVGGRGVEPLNPRDVLISMVESNQLSLDQLKEAKEGTSQYQLYQKVKSSYEASQSDALPKEYLVELLKAENSIISDQELILALAEQGSLKLEESVVQNLKKGEGPTTRQILVKGLESGTLKPDQMAIKPFSASAVVVEVDTGNVLSIVGYPTYDNNQMITDFNTYYPQLQDGIDQRNLLWNRATMTAKAPGSTFKMISALAGLEEGVVTPHTIIHDTGPYTKAGTPYPKCWFFTNNGYGHGAVDVKRALEVSCNTYFYEVAYLLGVKYGDAYGGIEALTKYADMFGLDKETGIELPETSPSVSHPDQLLNSSISRGLNVIRQLTHKGQGILDERVIGLLDGGIYPYADSTPSNFEDELEYEIQKHIKFIVDEELGSRTEDTFKRINQRLIRDFKQVLADGTSEYANQLTQEILSNQTSMNLLSKTKLATRDFLESHVSAKTDFFTEQFVRDKGGEEVAGAYEEALEILLENSETKDFTQEELQVIEKMYKEAKKDEVHAYKYIAKQLQSHIIEDLVDYLFEGVNLNWTSAINVRSAIGQGNNAFTPAQVGRYIAGLANGEEVYDLKLVGGLKDHKETGLYRKIEDKLLNTLDFKDENLKVVYEAMYEVINGSEGTARRAFADSVVKVAGKTGTAQEGDNEHSWFVGFAPYDDPEIAVVTSIYDASGLGMHNYLLANDVFNIVFEKTETDEKASIDNMFLE